MKIKLGDLRKMIRGAIGGGGAPGDGYAAVVTSDQAGFKATVYDPSAFEDVLLDTSDFSSLLTATGGELLSLLKGCIVGRVQIVSPSAPCWDAMMIASIAGPGKLMYGLAYALSPSGLLISDRDSMTPQAVGAWKNMAAKGGRDRKKLDDVGAPETPEPIDDCEVLKDDFLNYAYKEEGWEDGVLRSLQAEHDRLVNRVTKGGELTKADLERIITQAGFAYFQRRYREAQG